MGLRPSVKQDGPIKSSSSAINKPLRQPNRNHCNCEEPSSASADPPQPQREAWTARGQLLLNFHHAISRAINSPEMIRKCDEIAKNMHMHRTEAEQAQQQQQSSHPPQHSHNSASLSKDYTAEAQLIIENKSKRDANVRNKSLACGLVSFVLLRGTRGLSALLRRSIANSRGRTSLLATTGGSGASSSLKSYKFDKPAHLLKNTTANTTANTTSTSTTASAAAAASTKEPVSKLRTLFRLSLDLTISTTITFLSGTFLFLPKPSAYIEDMSKLPLCEGKSVYAEMVCHPLLKEYKRVMEEYGGRWPVATTVADADGSSNSGNATMGSTSTHNMSIASNDNETTTKENGGIDIGMTQEDVSLNIIRKFVENCSKRSIYEQALREERSVLLSNDSDSSSPPSSSISDSLEDALTVSRLIRRLTASSSSTSSDSISGSDTLSSASNNNNKLGTISIPNPGVLENISVDLDVDVFSLAPATTPSSSSNNGNDGS